MGWNLRAEGTEGTLTVPSASAEITFPRADSDLLIFFASSSTAPSAPVLLTYQSINGHVCHEPLQRERALTTSSSSSGAQAKEGRGQGKRIKKALPLFP